MKSALLAARHHIRDIQETAQRYHRATQDVLNTVDRIAEDITRTPWTAPTPEKREYTSSRPVRHDAHLPASDQYRHDPTMKELTNIIDGDTDHRWTRRYDTFTSELPDLGFEEAAYLHGYLDAQSYLNDEHPVLSHRFHTSVNYDGLGYCTRSRRRTTATQPIQL